MEYGARLTIGTKVKEIGWRQGNATQCRGMEGKKKKRMNQKREEIKRKENKSPRAGSGLIEGREE